MKPISCIVEVLARGQSNPEARLRAVKATASVVAAVSVAALPTAEFVRTHRRDLAEMGHGDRTLPHQAYPWVKVSGVVASLTSAIHGSSASTLIAALTAGTASRESAATFNRKWTYDTHVLALLLLGATPMPADEAGRRRRAALVLALMQAVVGSVYGQAALSKLRNDPAGWLRTGDTLRGSTALMGTSVGRRLVERPHAASVLSVAAVLAEAAIPFAVLAGPRWQRLAGAAGLAFHVSTAVTLKIPFWHMAALLPPLFIYRNQPGGRQPYAFGAAVPALLPVTTSLEAKEI